MTTQQPRRILVIAGATATGKSRLAVEVSQSLSCSSFILSVDSMQIYKGLDILSAKIRPAERGSVPHELLDVVELTNQDYSVSEFQKDAAKCLAERTSDFAIAVGGTNLWLEALLWPSQYIFDREEEGSEALDDTSSLSDAEVYSLLQSIDPVRAKQLHPHARRKIERAIRFFRSTGTLHSEHLSQCASQDSSPAYIVCVLWLHTDLAKLTERINARVDKMVGEGLEAELVRIHEAFLAERIDINKCAKGALQSIGLKEFFNWMQLRHCFLSRADGISPSEQSRLQAEFNDAVEHVKVKTRRYAISQEKWLRNHFASRLCLAAPGSAQLFRIDTSNAEDPENWASFVLKPAVSIVSYYINDDPCALSFCNGVEQIQLNFGAKPAASVVPCDICGLVMQDTQQLAAHIRGKGHRSKEKAFRTRKALEKK